ncbi:MAG TPA: bifunctional precorrin-2 dehydrogenase/sirohydrochlorin ferrochelatase [Acidimicrobiales bacterium]|nr:bifunctional precorrin-2 dehydrogenase/sirohydrochlorin ferrochelatase [Acidimicrobiales bacterium]
MPVEGPQYPVNLIVSGHRCLVVGGGAVAEGKVAGLVAAGARVLVVAPDVRPSIEAMDGVAVERRPYRPGEVAGHRLVITATDDPAVNRQVYLDGETAGVWVNSADDPASCSFTLPAVVRQGPITVTVATGGHSPAMATWLRRHVQGELGPEYVTLLDLLAERRTELREQGVSTEGLSWQEVLDSGMLDLVRSGNIAEARERLQACL